MQHPKADGASTSNFALVQTERVQMPGSPEAGWHPRWPCYRKNRRAIPRVARRRPILLLVGIVSMPEHRPALDKFFSPRQASEIDGDDKPIVPASSDSGEPATSGNSRHRPLRNPAGSHAMRSREPEHPEQCRGSVDIVPAHRARHRQKPSGRPPQYSLPYWLARY